MNCFVAHLKSCMRAQWLSFLGVAALLVVYSVAGSLYVPVERLRGTGFVFMFTLSMAMIAAGVFSADSMATELQGKHARFLERIPNGRSASLLAKWSIVTVGTLSVSLLALIISNLIRTQAGASWFNPFDDLVVRNTLPVVPSIAAFGFTVMAVSVWVPRTLLSIPLAALVLALIIVPIREGLSLLPYHWGDLPTGSVYIVSLMGMLASWLGYVRGRRFGGGTYATVWRGGSVLAVGVVASFTWFADTWLTYNRFDASDEYYMRHVVRGTGGRHLYLEVEHRSSSGSLRTFVLQVETASGAIEQLGNAGANLNPRIDFGGQGVHRITVLTPNAPAQSLQIDTWTGEALYTSQLDRVVESVPDEVVWRDTLLQMPGNDKAWVKHGKLYIKRADSDLRVHAWNSSGWWKASGYGVHWGEKGRVFDFIRGRSYKSRITQSAAIWVLEQGWLVASRRGGEPRMRGERPWLSDYYLPGNGWTMYDPDTRQHKPADGLRDGDRVCEVLADGRVLVIDSSSRLHVIDAESGVRHLLFERMCRPSFETERQANGDLLIELSEFVPNRQIVSGAARRSAQGLRRWTYRLSLGGTTLNPLASPRLLGGMSDADGNLIRESGERDGLRLEIVDRRSSDTRQIFPRMQ